MYHLYSGKGSVDDAAGTNRIIYVTAMISDQLQTWVSGGPGQPVNLPHGQHLPNGKYQFRVSDWRVVVNGIGNFFGQSGYIYLEFLDPHFADRQFMFYSDANLYDYEWNGGATFEKPDDWVNPLVRDYGHLPRTIICDGISMGQIIVKMFPIPHFVLKRV